MKLWLIAPLLAWAALAHADPAARRTFSEEASRQAAIYKSTGDTVPQGYVVGRSLLSYALVLPPGFKAALAKLGPGDRWLDVGAGEGRAVLDYVTGKYDVMLGGRGGKAQAIAMSIEDRRTHRWHETVASAEGRQLDYRYGRRLREYAPEELGRFQLMTDVLGGFSYTRYVSTYMDRALALLAVNGEFFTLLQDVRSERGDNRPYYAGSPFLTEIVKSDGSQTNVCMWLKSISCVEVTCDFTPHSAPPTERYHIRKVCEQVSVPELVPIHFEAGTPPERRFRLQ